MRNKGFTLIELLVVISIIGMLSSAILSNLNSVKTKAQGESYEAQAQQLLNAVLAYRADTGNLPDPGNVLANCLGHHAGGICGNVLSPDSESSQLNDALLSYFSGTVNLPQTPFYVPGPPFPPGMPDMLISTMVGIEYQCFTATCSRVKIVWYEKRPSSGNCLNGELVDWSSKTRRCTINIGDWGPVVPAVSPYIP